MSHLRTFVLLLVPGLFLAIPELRAQETPTGPNIVMILSDDQGWTDYGLMGHPDIKTPHLDRLATRQFLFVAHRYCR